MDTATTVMIREITNETELFCQYDGEFQPQPTYLNLDLEDGELFCDYNPNIGGGRSAAEFHQRTLALSIPCLTGRDANALMRDVAPIAQRILDGASIEWNGSNHVGELNTEAQAAYDELHEAIEALRNDPGLEAIQSLDAGDWYDGEDPAEELGLTADTTDAELATMETAAEADIKSAAQGVVVVRGLDRYLSDLRDAKRAEVRDSLEETAEQIDTLTERRNALIRQVKRFGDSDRAIGALAGLSHTQVQNIVKAGAPRYIVTVDEDTATWLVEGLVSAAGGRCVAQRGNGGEVELTNIGYFRGLGSDDDGSLTEDENGLQMWIEGIPYPVVVS